jgi:hypothetical protein
MMMMILILIQTTGKIVTVFINILKHVVMIEVSLELIVSNGSLNTSLLVKKLLGFSSASMICNGRCTHVSLLKSMALK